MVRAKARMTTSAATVASSLTRAGAGTRVLTVKGLDKGP